MIIGTKDTMITLLKKRPLNMHRLILVQLGLYALLRAIFSVFDVIYLYLVK